MIASYLAWSKANQHNYRSVYLQAFVVGFIVILTIGLVYTISQGSLLWSLLVVPCAAVLALIEARIFTSTYMWSNKNVGAKPKGA